MSAGGVVQPTSTATDGPTYEDDFTKKQLLMKMIFTMALIVGNTNPKNKNLVHHGKAKGVIGSFTPVLTGGPRVAVIKGELNVWGRPP